MLLCHLFGDWGQRRDATILEWLSVWWAESRNAAVSVWFVFRGEGFLSVPTCSSYPRHCWWVTSAFRAAPRLLLQWSWLGGFLSLHSFQFVIIYHSQIESKLKATNFMRKYLDTNNWYGCFTNHGDALTGVTDRCNWLPHFKSIFVLTFVICQYFMVSWKER